MNKLTLRQLKKDRKRYKKLSKDALISEILKKINEAINLLKNNASVVNYRQ